MQGDSVDQSGLAAPSVHLDIGITGHRSRHAVFSANRDAIDANLGTLLTAINRIALAEIATIEGLAPPHIRLHSLLAYGSDLMAVAAASARGWRIIAPLPFGQTLNLAINAQPKTLADMQALLEGQVVKDTETAACAADIGHGARGVHIFELADQDDLVTDLYKAHLAAPGDTAAENAFVALCSDRAAMAGRVMIEQSDLLIAIWDGVTRGSVGGTRHTIETALGQGVPVIWIDARNPQRWHVLRTTEELATLSQQASAAQDEAALQGAIREALLPIGDDWNVVRKQEVWPEKSNPMLHAYRRIEKLFGDPGNRPFRNLRQVYERPEAIAEGSGAGLLAAARALPDMDPSMPDRIATGVLRPFAWADGVSTWLSDAYRGGMVASFFLSAFAIVGGMAYLPFASSDQKWWFATFELALLAAIVGIFVTGKRLHWHERWFETRRVAEYFRHAPILLLLGAARSTGRWPRGTDGNWPEWYVRHALREIGLPQMKVTSPFLRSALNLMRKHHVLPQRAYHQRKAEELRRAQHNLDRLSEWLFVFAVISVVIYLGIEGAAAIGWLPHDLPKSLSKIFTFLGVLFPTLGGAFAGVHYFGDFARFAAISDITAEKLGAVDVRISLLLSAPDAEITYARTSELAHAIDEIVVSEIENWQSVFGGKHITVPV